MTPPTPAAVRAALKNGMGSLSVDESRDFRADPRPPDYLLRDHIRTVAQEMRAEADMAIEVNGANSHSDALRHFADKLEGKQNEST